MSLFLKNIFVEYKIIGWQFVCFTSLKISLHYFLAFIKSAYFHSLENNMHFLILWLLLRCSLNIFPHLCIHWSPLQYRKVSREKKNNLNPFSNDIPMNGFLVFILLMVHTSSESVAWCVHQLWNVFSYYLFKYWVQNYRLKLKLQYFGHLMRRADS